MSGHSKWSTIKHQKAVKDARRGILFTKLATQITAATASGDNLDMNPTLKVAVDNAKRQGMPKDNIERAIARGSGRGGGARLAEIIYEAYGPYGVGIIIRAITDNKNRVLSEIKATLNRAGGNLAEQGAVTYQFEEKGLICVNENVGKQEDLQLIAIEAGAQDIETAGDWLKIYTQPQDLQKVKKILEDGGAKIHSAEIMFKPKSIIMLDTEKSAQVARLLEILENINNISNVFSNFK
ncbi:MAG: hypothetical protein CEN89_508 [Candidatus Berkelbacteria bacterium Licking1014_7]|uniref:Probable transcriptional regulatory protein CEN89_508 n=1 Tax=Candidatus Berkelbacteria bacterium Licking1014_7 TaxID=2017147 RepID=A0A554LIN6_9BACT|nr:MAG: hypothetical protein CEN89_508 [Candidatus Berkelbacteria bacterium Licking1014_7]